MVVDDSSTMRTIIQKELEAVGYRVITFGDGLAALASLHWMQAPPDLITLDIDMPRLDGFGCCEKLREMEAGGLFGSSSARIPVLFVSANDTFANRSRGFQLGSLQFISKPFRRGDIADAVNRVLRPEQTFAGMTALVIDDNRSVRRMAGDCLATIGLSIVEAENGQQAFDLIAANPGLVDLAIVDHTMPVMRGDEFIHLARQIPELRHLPILALCASREANDMLQMFAAGCTDYLVKPFLAEELLARAQVHLQLRRHLLSLEESNKHLYDKSVSDPLTGLHNKRFFQKNLDELFLRARRIGLDLSCLFLDIDHFKRVNDSCGHGFGDYVLATMGHLIRETARRGDLAARFGGEEFVLLLPNTDLETARAMGDELRERVEGHHFSELGQQWPVTISIGIASLHSARPASAAGLLQQADQALYLAKSGGRNRVAVFCL